MKKTIAIMTLVIYILMCLPNIISAEEENIFHFNAVANSTTQNANASISSAKLYGAAALTSGISGNCIYFDGINSYVELPNENRVQELNSVTVAFWMKPKIDNNSGVTPVLHCGNVFEIGINNETRKINVSLQTSTAISLTSVFNLERDMWHHIAVTYGDGRLCLYVNGKLDSHSIGTGNVKFSNEAMYLGTNRTSYYKGSIDEFAFYKETLSEKDVGEIYHEYMDAITDWNYVSYPIKSLYQHGVSSASSELFKNSKIDKPINTGFEERNEINAINTENQNGQLEIVEDKYAGKFALKIKKITKEIIPLQETEYFKTIEDDLLTTTSLQRDDSGIDISVNENKMTISGTKNPNEIVAILVKNENEITYLSQTTANNSGYFEFKFPVDRYGNYTVRVGGSQSGSQATSFYFADPNSKTPDVIKTEEVNVKCNSYSLMIKPMYKSETISFYVKTFIQDESGKTKEQYVLIKSDNDGDGIFKIGEDLSRGKWQKIELNLLDTDILFQSEAVAGLYVDANVGSEWLFDDIDSKYRKINKTDIELSQFADGNVVYRENALQFAKTEDGTAFIDNEKVVTDGIEVVEKISGVTIDSGRIFADKNNTSENISNRETLFYHPLSSDVWSVDDTDYDTSETSVGKKVEKTYYRNVLPDTSGYTKTMTIKKEENERLFRLKLKQGISQNRSITITDKNGVQTVLSMSAISKLTQWYDDDITITPTSSSYSLRDILTIVDVEYYKKEVSTEKNIVLKNEGIATVKLHELETADRATLTLKIFKADIASWGTLLLNFKDNSGNTYYHKCFKLNLTNDIFEIKDIIPKIRKGTQIEIINQFTENNGNGADEITISDFKIESMTKGDWNLEEKNKYYISGKTYFYNTLDANTTQETLVGKWLNEIADNECTYAFSHHNIGGIVNVSSVDQTLELDSAKNTIIRIINLCTEDSYIKDSNGNVIYLSYGECDYLINADCDIVIPPNPNILIVSVTYLDQTLTNPNNLNYTLIDGLWTAYDVNVDGTKVFFANINDKNTLYSYDFNTKEYKKICDVAATIITVSPDEKLAAIKKADGTYCILNLQTQKETVFSCDYDVHKFYFSPQNELFVMTVEDRELAGNTWTYYTLYVLQNNVLVKMIKEDGYNGSTLVTPITFDNTGNYAYVDRLKKLYKKTNGIWNELEQLEYSGTISSDGKTIFGTQILDINTGTVENLPDGFSFVSKTYDDLLLIKKEGSKEGLYYYYLYNPITGENNKILENQGAEFTNPEFYSGQNVFMVFMPGGMVIRHYFTNEKPEVKYALSFDGKDNWYIYTGGIWKLLSKSKTPTINEMQSSGMTEEEVNGIPAAAYEKLYEDGNDILTVDVAIYMNSRVNNQSPAIKQIVVSTCDEAELSGLYGVHIEKYEKNEYRSVSSIFPIENFASNAECYYLLYIGNDWLYTYKDNKLVKTVESADELLSNIDTSWITFKQYGMTAKELRSIPSDVINNLFVNDNYANTEFGVIYVVKTDSDDTNGFTVNFRLKSESSFIAEDDVVIEIIMGGGDKIVVDSNEFSKTDIENLLSWIEARQNGLGDIFYRIQNGKKQYFINYYMINSVNVYNGEEYRESHSQIAK